MTLTLSPGAQAVIRELFRKHGIGYDVSDKSKSELYVELLLLLTTRRADLLDNSCLVTQLLSLERRTGASGKGAIDHPREGLYR
jgi:hypothetical protein